ncbi:hypothetical protein SAMN06265218_10535 [Fodinibius sediminis]|uniref:Uncharacterized protein n=2 Tax=Fodinibius sediminis TaxID=1214077 RepID=A0A521C4U5_9BACT|nr:hypothetical protein SAMN06265218_10535 [Fodinibius sediminis]
MESLPPLQNWPAPVRKLIFTFVLVSFIGVVVGGVMIEVTTHLTPTGVVEQYKGISKSKIDTADELKFPKPAKEMLITTHNHILGLSSLFLIVGLLYLATGRDSWLQISIAVEPLISLIVTFGGLWVMRYLWSPFVYVVILSGTLMVGTYAWMSLVVMKSCLSKQNN